MENTFGRWKGRFTRFSKRVDMCVTSIIPVTKASCILHNLCEIQNNNFLPKWECVNSSVEEPTLCGYNDNVTVDAEGTRSILANYFVTKNNLESSDLDWLLCHRAIVTLCINAGKGEGKGSGVNLSSFITH